MTPGKMVEIDYYDINNIHTTDNGEVTEETMMNSVYERLKVVAKKRRDFLVDIIKQFPNRSIYFNDD